MQDRNSNLRHTDYESVSGRKMNKCHNLAPARLLRRNYFENQDLRHPSKAVMTGTQRCIIFVSREVTQAWPRKTSAFLTFARVCGSLCLFLASDRFIFQLLFQSRPQYTHKSWPEFREQARRPGRNQRGKPGKSLDVLARHRKFGQSLHKCFTN